MDVDEKEEMAVIVFTRRIFALAIFVVLGACGMGGNSAADKAFLGRGNEVVHRVCSSYCGYQSM